MVGGLLSSGVGMNSYGGGNQCGTRAGFGGALMVGTC